VYRRKDLEHLLRIRHLLYEERFTIEGARSRLRELGHDEGPAPERPPPVLDRDALRSLKQGIVELLRLVDE
jgi:DNA-binding transcriptional MerR regulator